MGLSLHASGSGDQGQILGHAHEQRGDLARDGKSELEVLLTPEQGFVPPDQIGVTPPTIFSPLEVMASSSLGDSQLLLQFSVLGPVVLFESFS